MKDLTSRVTGPSISEMLAEQNAQLMKDIASRAFAPDGDDTTKDCGPVETEPPDSSDP